MVEEFTQAQTSLIERINNLTHGLRSARLSGSNVNDIENLMLVIKVRRNESLFLDLIHLEFDNEKIIEQKTKEKNSSSRSTWLF